MSQPSTIAPLPRYVELIRVSTDGQADRDTPATQRAALDKLRLQRPGTLIERIEPGIGISGALPIAQRPDLQRVIELLHKEGFNELRVYRIDRIERSDDPLDKWFIPSLLARAKAVIVDASNSVFDPSSPMGRLNFAFNSEMATSERHTFRTRTGDTRRTLAGENKIPVASVPLGFRRDEATRLAVVVEEEARLVRRMYAEALAGKSLRTIAHQLNDEGLPSPRGKQWSTAMVGNALHNPAYKGKYELRLGEAHYTIDVPAIVSEGDWEQVQVLLATRRSTPRRTAPGIDALCQARAFCGSCGRAMHTPYKKGRQYRYYVCGSQHRNFTGEPCSNHALHPVRPVDDAVWTQVHKYIDRSDLLADAVRGAETSNAKAESSWSAQIEAGARTLARLKRTEAHILDLLGSEHLSPETAKAKLADIKAKRLVAERSLAIAQAAVADQKAVAQAVGAANDRLAELRALLATASQAQKAEVLDALVPALPGFGIFIFPDRRVEVRGVLELGARPGQLLPLVTPQAQAEVGEASRSG